MWYPSLSLETTARMLCVPISFPTFTCLKHKVTFIEVVWLILSCHASIHPFRNRHFTLSLSEKTGSLTSLCQGLFLSISGIILNIQFYTMSSSFILCFWLLFSSFRFYLFSFLEHHSKPKSSQILLNIYSYATCTSTIWLSPISINKN